MELGIYHVDNYSNSVIQKDVNIINQFNNNHDDSKGFILLSYVIGNNRASIVVKIPVKGNTILLNEISMGYWTILVTEPQYIQLLIYALDHPWIGYIGEKAVLTSNPAIPSPGQDTLTIFQDNK
ncbi:hypothetical protein GCM10007981_04260 [Thermocladium modestius]|uniref:Uncharacterized protein n=1 Tax=Thermocladium modestius TaxID=62609 RepID=A0A830GT64_9CREN|nr:hypothetical protein [Thermocladium modestius]GGP19664.1 hypothetical protein GCM10007981_04260 [Thermocladium modestius]